MAIGRTNQDSLNEAAGGVRKGYKNAKTAVNLARKSKVGKAGAKAAKKAAKGLSAIISLKIKLIALAIALGLILIVTLVSLIPVVIGNTMVHQSDPEALSDGKDITYFGNAEEDLKVLTDTEQHATEVVTGILDNAFAKSKNSLYTTASFYGWEIQEYVGCYPSTQQNREAMVVLYATYSASMKNALSDDAFEYYQETSAIDDLEEKLDGVSNKKHPIYPYGNLIYGADFLRNEDGTIKTEQVLVKAAYTDSLGFEHPAKYKTIVFPRIYQVSIEEVAQAAFFPDGVDMQSPYYEEDKDAAEDGLSYTTYAEIINGMSYTLGNLLYGEEFWQGSNIFWSGLIGVPNEDIVETARSQLGNVGGYPYWSWYPFSSRVHWCACFVSWCADQCGYIEAGIIPKYASCREGVKWFKNQNRFQGRASGYEPKAGDIIFFDWATDSEGRNGQANHTGIVVGVIDGYVHTIEGNKGDKCAEGKYRLSSLDILGYGTPDYPAEKKEPIPTPEAYEESNTKELAA